MEISIIVPIYNVQEYLRTCLDSLLNQSFEKDFEVICINDGSTDKSLEILREYQIYSRIKVINQDNQGLSKARNRGIEQASGDYLMFIDSDDYLANNNVLSLLYNEVVKEDLDFVAGTVEFSYDNKEKNFTVLYPEELTNKNFKGSVLFEKIINKVDYLSIPCNKIYKKDFITRNNLYFYEGIIYEDIEFTVRCYFNADKIKIINSNIFMYRQRENSITNNDIMFKEKYKNYLFVAESLIGFNKLHQSKAINQLILYMYVILIKNKKSLSAVEIFEIKKSIDDNKIWLLFLKSNKVKYKIFGLINLLIWSN